MAENEQTRIGFKKWYGHGIKLRIAEALRINL
jgi:hypothetical protein